MQKFGEIFDLRLNSVKAEIILKFRLYFIIMLMEHQHDATWKK